MFHTSIQDIRIWGQYGQNSISGSLNVFEAYIQSNFNDTWSLKLGRQAVELDNGRIFSKANWNQVSKAHDGLNLLFKKKKLSFELMGFFNQTAEQIYETDYALAKSNYKALAVHYLKYIPTKWLSLTTINAVDAYQSPSNAQTTYSRGTSGGRLDFKHKNLLITFSGYYQYGQLSTSQNISAFYLQPEVKYSINKKWIARLGMEYMSGDDATSTSSVSHSFVPLYGVAFKFMGHMNYFTSFPKDVNNAGLINPYLFFEWQLNKNISLKNEGHLFYLQNKMLSASNKLLNSYLGFENDIKIKYRFSEDVSLDAGFSYMIATRSMQAIKGGNNYQTPLYGFLMVTYTPTLFHSERK